MDKSKTYIIEWDENTECWCAHSEDFQEMSFFSEKYIKPDCYDLVPVFALADCLGFDGSIIAENCSAFTDQN